MCPTIQHPDGSVTVEARFVEANDVIPGAGRVHAVKHEDERVLIFAEFVKVIDLGHETPVCVFPGDPEGDPLD
jgi:hypothetical protein